MKKIFKSKYIIILISILLLFTVINKLVVDAIQKPVKLVESASIWQDVELENSKITDNSIVTWDNNSLKIYNFQGELIEEILGNGYYNNIYYFDKEIGVLDKQLNVLYLYDSSGNLNNKIQLSGSVYSIWKKQNNFFVHRKDELSSKRLETITKLEASGKESPLYETERFIINFELEANNLFVSEITAENYSYKSVLNIINKGSNQIFDFANETVLDIKKYGKDLIAITNKNIYKIKNNEKEKVELKNFKSYLFEDNKILVLYDNKLVEFNSNLAVVNSYDINISNSGLFKHDGGYFVWGPTDLAGYVGQQREFTKSFDSIVYGVSSNNKALLVTHKYNTELYLFETIEEEKN